MKQTLFCLWFKLKSFPSAYIVQAFNLCMHFGSFLHCLWKEKLQGWLVETVNSVPKHLLFLFFPSDQWWFGSVEKTFHTVISLSIQLLCTEVAANTWTRGITAIFAASFKTLHSSTKCFTLLFHLLQDPSYFYFVSQDSGVLHNSTCMFNHFGI